MMIKYKIFLLLIQIYCSLSQFPKILWTYWEDDFEDFDKTDILVKAFHSNHQRMVNEGWEVRLLNNHSIKKYLDEIPFYEGDFYTLDYILTSHKADYVRCLLLSYYGGVYFDMSTILIQDFSWLQFENLRSNPDVLNKYGEEPEVVVFTHPQYGSKEIYFDQSLNRAFQVAPGYQIWFVAAVPNSKFLRQYLPKLRQGFIDRIVSQQGQKKYIGKIIQEQKIQVGILRNNYYLSSLSLVQIQIQRKQRELDLNHKKSRYLAAWHYKIWHIPAIKGPLSTYLKLHNSEVEHILRYSVQKLNVLMGVSPIRYFVKLTSSARVPLGQFFHPQSNKWQQIKLKNCPKKNMVYSDSIVYRYLIQNSSFENNFTIDTENDYLADYSKCIENLNNEIIQKHQYIEIIDQAKSKLIIAVVILSILLFLFIFLCLRERNCFKKYSKVPKKSQMESQDFQQETNYPEKI